MDANIISELPTMQDGLEVVALTKEVDDVVEEGLSMRVKTTLLHSPLAVLGAEWSSVSEIGRVHKQQVAR